MASIPSIATIPSGYKATKLYSVLPVDGSADLTFSRGSSATRVANNGIIETMADDVPRLDYSDGGCPSLLLEPQRRNMYDYSEDLNNWYTSLVNATISSNSIIAPDGTLTADKLVEDSTPSVTHDIRKLSGTPTLTATNSYTFSFFAKSGERSKIFVSNDIGTAAGNCLCDLNTGVISSNTFDSGSMIDYGNGWWRIILTKEATGSDDYDTRIYIADDLGNITYNGDGSSGLYIWGLQVEDDGSLGSSDYATSYIPTSGAAATRIAETCSKTGLGSYINSSEGVLYVEMSALVNDSTRRTITLSDGTTSNRVILRYDNSSNRIQAFLKVLGSTYGNILDSSYDIP